MPRRYTTRADHFDLESQIGFLIYRVHQRSLAIFRHLLEPTGLTPQQFGVLALLAGQSRQCQAALCARGAIDPNTMVGLVDRLESAGLVDRERDAHDRRAYVVRLTPKGRRVLGDCLPLEKRAADVCWRVLSTAERDRLRNLLRKVLHAIE